MTQCLPYIFPKLAQQGLAVMREDSPTELVAVSLERVLSTPEGVEAAQKLALLMAQQDTSPAPPRILPPSDQYRDR
jgi:hypothetical protein